MQRMHFLHANNLHKKIHHAAEKFTELSCSALTSHDGCVDWMLHLSPATSTSTTRADKLIFYVSQRRVLFDKRHIRKTSIIKTTYGITDQWD